MIIYFDENLPPKLVSALHILNQGLNNDISILSIKDEFGRGIRDEDWIPKVGAESNIVITQDFATYKNNTQKQLILENGLNVIYLRPHSKKISLKYWEMVKLIINNWENIIFKCKNENMPFILELKRNELRRL